MNRLLVIIIALAVAVAAPASIVAADADAPEIDWAAHKFTVVFFIMHDCPICNSYVPEMNRIAAEYGERGFEFNVAYLDADFSPEQAQKHIQEYRVVPTLMIGDARQLAAKAGVRVVPEAAVFNAKGEVLYCGRIDDLYADIGKRRPAPTERDLRAALDAIHRGGKPKRTRSPGVGCPIELGTS